jgi:hypothetical protein
MNSYAFLIFLFFHYEFIRELNVIFSSRCRPIDRVKSREIRTALVVWLAVRNCSSCNLQSISSVKEIKQQDMKAIASQAILQYHPYDVNHAN